MAGSGSKDMKSFLAEMAKVSRDVIVAEEKKEQEKRILLESEEYLMAQSKALADHIMAKA